MVTKITPQGGPWQASDLDRMFRALSCLPWAGEAKAWKDGCGAVRPSCFTAQRNWPIPWACVPHSPSATQFIHSLICSTTA